ncbi:hypothetical protein [Halopenitus persicus]|uniref:Uncharacterized protein n=1 Tax=Halopenitus persicus TaxID=1048396 RepID=A0A1H3KJG0_9EURY|nr:hypothetical protein [Halopenitus persicus]SDY52287.1 hypothetical protein SAMN05216564_10645 [Halopenitus persicus]
MGYDKKPADDEIVTFLKSIDYAARPAEISQETDYSQNYVTKRCRVMWEYDVLRREQGRYIVGHDIPGLDSPVVLPEDRDSLLEIVTSVAPDRVSEVHSKSADEIRSFIRDELATDTYPLGNRKVSYASA